MKKLNLLVALLLLNLTAAFAQPAIEPVVIQQFKELFLKKDFPGIYNLYAESFRQRTSAAATSGLFTAVTNGIGNHVNFKQTAQDGAQYVYLITGDLAAAEAEFTITAEQKISGLRVKPASKTGNTSPALPVVTSNKLVTTLDKQVDSIVRLAFGNSYVGMAIAVIRNGEVNYYGYGETFNGSKTIPSANDIFEIGSVTKTFTATILANLVKEGKIDINKDFRYYLPKLFPGFKGAVPAITVQQLANHTAGLPSFPVFTPESVKPNEDPFNYFTQANLEAYLKSSLPQQPAGKFAYSNLGFAILGYVLEQVTHTPYDALVKRYITKPLKMYNTQIKVEPGKLTTKGYRNHQEMAYLNLQAMAPAGIIKSNLQDMVLYAKANMQKLGATGIAQKSTYTDDRLKVGMAWITLNQNGREVIFHNGGTTGYSGFLAFDEASKSAVIILNNTTSDVTQLGFTVLQKVM